MERAALVTKAVLSCCELPKISGRLRDDIVVKFEYDTAGSLAVNLDVKLHTSKVGRQNEYIDKEKIDFRKDVDSQIHSP